MATTGTQHYRGYNIVARQQWANSWCADAYSSQDDLPFLIQSALDTLSSSKKGAVVLIKESIDRLLETGRSP